MDGFSSVSVVQESCDGFLLIVFGNVLEVRSDQVDDIVAFVKREIGEFADWNWIVN
mgnify:CR=1 FL=1